MSEIKDPEDCKWYLTHKGVLGCFLHPLSDNTPSPCMNSEKYPCSRLKEDREYSQLVGEPNIFREDGTPIYITDRRRW